MYFLLIGNKITCSGVNQSGKFPLVCSIKRGYFSTFGGGKFNLSERTFNCIMTSSSFLSPRGTFSQASRSWFPNRVVFISSIEGSRHIQGFIPFYDAAYS